MRLNLIVAVTVQAVKGAFPDPEISLRTAKAVFRTEVPSFSDETLEAEARPELREGILHPFRYKMSDARNANEYWGLTDKQITPALFSEAWNSLLGKSDMARDQGKGCEDMIRAFWLRRPHWFVPTKAEIMELRECSKFAMDLAGSGDFSDDSQLAIINRQFSVAADLMITAYSPLTEVYLRSPRTALDGLRNYHEKRAGFKGFQEFIATSPVIKGLLDSASTAADFSSLALNEEDQLMAAAVLQGGASAMLVHSGDFLDSVYAAAAIKGNGQAVLLLWFALAQSVEGFDDNEIIFESRKDGMSSGGAAAELHERFTQSRRGMGSARAAWRAMAGNLVDALEPQSGALACLESAVGSYILEDTSPFFPLDERPGAIPLFYNCLVDGIEAGELTIPDNEHRLNNVAALMHLVRMTHSGLAFIVSVSPPSSP